MRILMLNYEAPPTRGGIISYLHHTCIALAKAGHDVKVAVACNGQVFHHATQDIDGVQYIRMSAISRPRTPYKRDSQLQQSHDWMQILHGWEPDIVNIHTLMGFPIGDAREFQRLHIPVVFTLHNYFYMCPFLECFQHGAICTGPSVNACTACHPDITADNYKAFILYTNAALQTADHLIYISDGQKHVYTNFGITNKYCTVLPSHSYGCDILQQQSLIPHNPNSRRIDFGFMATLAPHKGIEIAIEAFNCLHDDDLHLQIWGLGKPSYMHYLNKLANSCRKPNNIHFNGAYELKDLRIILQNIDALLAPVRWNECNGLNVQEALSAGVPVFGTKIGGLADMIIGGVNGRTIEYSPLRSTMIAQLYATIQPCLDIPRELRNLQATAKLPYTATMPSHISKLIGVYSGVIK